MQNTMLDSTISNSLQLFQNTEWKIRVVMRDGEPWFVAKDVATCIEHKDVTTMCRVCRDKDKVVVNYAELKHSADLAECFSEQQSPNLTLISESGLYRILAKCNLPKCEPFESWVFDEVLPSIRKTGGYGIRTVDDMINDPDTAIRLLTQLKIMRLQNKQLEMERDEAIRTKALIGSRREATAMNTASQKSKECEKLREQIGDSKTYKAVTAITWLPDYFNMSNRGLYGSLAANLKKIEAGMTSEFKHIDIPDSRFGKVKAYHVDVIERLHEMVQADENLMAKYRKITSV